MRRISTIEADSTDSSYRLSKASSLSNLRVPPRMKDGSDIFYSAKVEWGAGEVGEFEYGAR